MSSARRNSSRLSAADPTGTPATTMMEGVDEGGPGVLYMQYVVMEDLQEKLKLLNCDVEFFREMGMKPISRHYFAISSNPGEQFYLFSTLAAWLIRKTGKPFENPQEYDDPNSTVSNILDACRSLGIAVDFPPNKLKTGSGEQVIFVIDRLADAALQNCSFSWERPPPVVDVGEDDDGGLDGVDEQELVLEALEESETIPEDSGEIDDDEDENVLLNLEELKVLTGIGSKLDQMLETQRPEVVMESNTNIEEWRLEVERVLPHLKVTVRNDMRDWRTRIEQMREHKSGIEANLKDTRGQLDKFHTDVSRTLEKISTREKYLNNQLEHLLAEFRNAQDRFAEARQHYASISGGVNERKETFRQISSRLEALKDEMERRGASMTDGSPLVSIRKALTRIKQELTAMDIRHGVVEHTLLQARLRDRSLMQRDIAAVATHGRLTNQNSIPQGLY